MPRLPRILAVAAASLLALSACSTVTDGRLAAGSVPDAHLKVTGGTTSSFDEFAQNALSDITAFWATNYSKVSGGKKFTPLEGGYFSVDGRQVAISTTAGATAKRNECIAQEYDAIVDNAFYCQSDDSIAWDRSPTHLLGQLADKYGLLLVGLIFAHEFGHAISNRLGIFDDDPRTIYTESQADCAAGAWARSVLDGDEPHFTDTTSADLDDALEGYLNARDSTPDTPQDISHGNGFDRLSAVADGLERGVTYCYSKGYFASRNFTERPYTDPSDYSVGGNLPFAEAVDTSKENGLTADLNRFWSAEARSRRKSFAAVSIVTAAHPPCAPSARFAYCPEQNKVYFDPSFARSVYYSLPAVSSNESTGDVTLADNQPADYAIGQLFAIGWGMAVRHQVYGRSLSGAAALTAAVCYSGSYAKDVNVPLDRDHEFVLSPSDLDEAVSATLDQTGESTSFDARGTSGLDRIQAFVKGYNGGFGAC